MTSQECLVPPASEPTPLFALCRGSYATELLTAAVAHFNVFGRMATGPQSFVGLRQALGLAERPASVLVTALRAMGLIEADERGVLALTTMARAHLTPGSPHDISGYIAL